MLKAGHNQTCLLALLMAKGLLETYRSGSSLVARVLDKQGVRVKGES